MAERKPAANLIQPNGLLGKPGTPSGENPIPEQRGSNWRIL